jgi:hypothetical protein
MDSGLPYHYSLLSLLSCILFSGIHRGTHDLYKACMRVHAPYINTTRVHTPADEVLVVCLRTQEILLRKRQSSSPLQK